MLLASFMLLPCFFFSSLLLTSCRSLILYSLLWCSLFLYHISLLLTCVLPSSFYLTCLSLLYFLLHHASLVCYPLVCFSLVCHLLVCAFLVSTSPVSYSLVVLFALVWTTLAFFLTCSTFVCNMCTRLPLTSVLQVCSLYLSFFYLVCVSLIC